MNVGLFFGTFNPIHVGHLIIANHIACNTSADEVWLVVTPHNPLKKKRSLLKDHHRLAIVREAVEGNACLKVSDVEFKLEQPSYTVETLAYLKEKHPGHKFSLIMGEDNLRTFEKWRNYEQIIELVHTVFVYPRAYTIQEKEKGSLPEINREFKGSEKIQFVDAPVMKISSSFIRNAIKNGNDVRYMLTPPVHKYVTEMHFYEE